MRLVYTGTALADLRSIFQYVTQEADEITAHTILVRVEDAISSLVDFPEQGRAGRIPLTRELVIPHTSLVVAYRIIKSEVQILALIHSARRWPDDFS
jgi:addiction module RelE/StbE family toxin